MENIESAISDFIFHCRYEKNLSPKTIKAYGIDLSQFKAFIRLKGYSEIIKEIDKTVVKEFLQEISQHKPKTIKRKIATVKAMFTTLNYKIIFFNYAKIFPLQTNLQKEYTLFFLLFL